MSGATTSHQRVALDDARRRAAALADGLDGLADLPGVADLARAQRQIAERLHDLDHPAAPVPDRGGESLRSALRRAPLGAIDARALAGSYAQPRKVLATAARDGRLHRLSRGVYVSPPRSAPDGWRPTVETAAAVVGTVTMRRPAPLMGMSAARLHGALPRAVARAWVAAPRTHRPVELVDGGVVVFVTRRGFDDLDVEAVPSELGPLEVTSVEQTILDLLRGLGSSGLESEVTPVVHALADQTDPGRLHRLVRQGRGAEAAFQRYLELVA